MPAPLSLPLSVSDALIQPHGLGRFEPAPCRGEACLACSCTRTERRVRHLATLVSPLHGLSRHPEHVPIDRSGLRRGLPGAQPHFWHSGISVILVQGVTSQTWPRLPGSPSLLVNQALHEGMLLKSVTCQAAPTATRASAGPANPSLPTKAWSVRSVSARTVARSVSLNSPSSLKRDAASSRSRSPSASEGNR